MTIRQIKISELVSLTNSSEYSDWKHVPISTLRAYSQSLNPSAYPGDVALVIAIDDISGEVISYAGALPSKINSPQTSRFAWNSCWWIAEGAGTDVAMKVFISFLQTWEKKVAFSDMTEKTFKIIRSLGFCHTMMRDALVLNFRPGMACRLESLSYSKKKLRYISKPLLLSGLPWLADRIASLFLYFPQKLQFAVSKDMKPAKIEFPDKNDFDFIRKAGSDSFYLPEAEDLKMPVWIEKPSKQNKYLLKKYYFSSFADNFSTYWLRWEKDGIIKALVMLSVRDGVAKTLYVYCREDFRDFLAAGIISYCVSNREIRSLVTAQPILTNYISGRKFFALSKRKFTRYSAVSKDLMSNFSQEMVLQDGDGDYRFT